MIDGLEWLSLNDDDDKWEHDEGADCSVCSRCGETTIKIPKSMGNHGIAAIPQSCAIRSMLQFF